MRKLRRDRQHAIQPGLNLTQRLEERGETPGLTGKLAHTFWCYPPLFLRACAFEKAFIFQPASPKKRMTPFEPLSIR